MQVPIRSQGPHRRDGHVTSVVIGGEAVSLTAAGTVPGTPGEVRIGWGKHGSAQAGLIDGYATALSLALQHGAPLADLLRPALGLGFAPSGATDDPEIPQARSVIDYACRRLAIDWLPPRSRAPSLSHLIGWGWLPACGHRAHLR